MRSGQVKIGPSFFAKSKNDYSDWRFAIAREFIQNSIDARATKIHIDIQEHGENTLVTIKDDGCGMSEDTIVNKLLAIGESGKDFVGTVGGFGLAKLILYFTHESYEIKTNDLLVKGSGADYTIEESDFFNGTSSTIVVKGDEKEFLYDCFKRVISMTQWSGSFSLNGESYLGRLKKGKFRKELDWCRIYTNKSFGNRLIVRIGGIVMFYRYVTADDRCVIVELKGNSADVLQSSRDTLKYDCRCELDELIRQLTVDRHSAFRSDCTYYQHWEGEKLENHDQSSLPEILKIKEELAEMQNERLAATTPVESEDSEESTPIESPDHETHLSVVRATPSTPAEPMFEVDVEKHFRHDFVIKNDAAMQIPAYYTPGNFSAYSDKLCRAWVKLLLETYRTFGRCETFSVGFYFSREEDVWAEFERGDYGRVYYLNPAKVKYTATGVPVFARRWGFTWNIRYHLIVTAVHEYIHSLGFSGHDERFVQKSDECMAVVMKNLKRFRACFQ